MIPLSQQDEILRLNDICEKIIQMSGAENMDINLAVDIASILEDGKPGIIEYFMEYAMSLKGRGISILLKKFTSNKSTIYLVI